jgi:hypothetical protein
MRLIDRPTLGFTMALFLTLPWLMVIIPVAQSHQCDQFGCYNIDKIIAAHIGIAVVGVLGGLAIAWPRSTSKAVLNSLFFGNLIVGLWWYSFGWIDSSDFLYPFQNAIFVMCILGSFGGLTLLLIIRNCVAFIRSPRILAITIGLVIIFSLVCSYFYSDTYFVSHY